MNFNKTNILLFHFLLLIPFLATAQELDTIPFNLPLFIINTNDQPIPNEPKLTAQLGIINNPNGINFHDDPFTDYDGNIGIEIRGNGSANWAKKSYSFETRKDDGSNKNVSLLGMPEENDWILYASYIDRTGMRNVLTYDLARKMGHYASRTAYCEVILNGEYQGVYVLMEKIKRDKNRVDVPKFEDTTPTDEGGYIIRTDSWWNTTVGWQSSILYEVDGTAYWPRYQYVYPKKDDINPDQKQFIQDFMLEVDEAFFNAPYEGFDKLYNELIDINSFIDFFIINEFTQNPDGYRLSTFKYLDTAAEQPRLKLGPVWDYNVGYGNYFQRFDRVPSGWDYDNGWWEVTVRIPFWWNRLMSDDFFVNKMRCRWEELRKTFINNEAFNQCIDAIDQQINTAMQRSHDTWPEEQITVDLDWASTNSYDTDLSILRQWISDRIDWIDSELGLSIEGFIESPVKVHPNPAGDHFNISYYNETPIDANFNIYDFSGKRIQSGIANGRKGITRIEITDFHVPAGIYLIEILIGDERFTSKLVRK